MIRKIPVELITALLVILFVYAAFSKILEADTFKRQMLNQPLPGALKENLFWLVTGTEIATSILLLIKPLRYFGLMLACFLMAAFTLYVILILANAFAYVPCSCGGVLNSMSWQVHLIFNIFFTLLAFTGLLIERKQRPTVAT
ncbi:MAG: MauE/DoxX family redox-associated membrane protein [Chryseolinea sp.]